MPALCLFWCTRAVCAAEWLNAWQAVSERIRASVTRCRGHAQARAVGADAALLIAAVLPNTDLAYLLKSAAKLGLQVIIEVHTIAGAGQLHSETAWRTPSLALLEHEVRR